MAKIVLQETVRMTAFFRFGAHFSATLNRRSIVHWYSTVAKLALSSYQNIQNGFEPFFGLTSFLLCTSNANSSAYSANIVVCSVGVVCAVIFRWPLALFSVIIREYLSLCILSVFPVKMSPTAVADCNCPTSSVWPRALSSTRHPVSSVIFPFVLSHRFNFGVLKLAQMQNVPNNYI